MSWSGWFFFLIWIRCCLGLLENGENAFEMGYVVVRIVSYIFCSLRLALRDVKHSLCRRDVWKLEIIHVSPERYFIKI